MRKILPPNATPYKCKYLLTAILLAGSHGMAAQQTVSEDSLYAIGQVTVVGSKGRDIIPSQRLSGEQLQHLNTVSVADALRFFSGMQVKDYGGVGGIKTVNIRSMGSQHLGIYYDGVELGNAQNGQVDLGQFSMDNVEEISVYNGQKSAIFQTASDFGNAGSVYIRTRQPHFAAGEQTHLKAKVKYGSSDMLRLNTLIEQRLTERVTASVTVGGLTSSGKYKFRYRRMNYDGSVAYDTTAVRQNGEVKDLRAEANLYGTLAAGSWGAKAYTYHSQRGIPGAIVNNVWRRHEEQWDHNTFVQGWWQKNVTTGYSARILAKYAYYATRYVNNDTTTLMVDNRYRQQEAYLSTSHMVEILPGWNVSACYDFRWSHLWSDMERCPFPTRYHNLFSLATVAEYGRLRMQGSILANVVNDRLTGTESPSALVRWTPALFVSLYPFETRYLSLRAFAKRSFRMPTFNDLYYADMGNSRLRPETASQYDIGLLYERRWRTGLLRDTRLQADGYFNAITDKIIAYPKGQQFRWTMMNLGRVHITGLDVSADATLQPWRDLQLTMRLQYTYQDARDVTDKTTSYYRDQIPYIPYNSGAAMIGVAWRGWTVNYSFIYTGFRYSQQENILYNKVQPWYTSDLNIMREMRLKKTRLRMTLEVNNLFSQDYDVIFNYPMPKRNYALSLDVEI
ncbi:MAG: TonB-dependent receptor plug domain-containing protein [Prevotella sp.]